MTNNNDLTTTVVAPGGITLPDVLTESDLFMNLDSSLLLPQSLDLRPDPKRPDPVDLGSQLLSESSFGPSPSRQPARLEDHTLVDLDLGDENTLDNDVSVEFGRDAPAPRPVEEDLFSDAGKFNDVDVPLDLGEDDGPLDKMDMENDVPQDNMSQLLQQEDAMDLGGEDEIDIGGRGEDEHRFERDNSSPLSSAASDATDKFHGNEDSRENQEDDVTIQQSHRAKRRKVMELDHVTGFNNNQIKAQQANRSGILKPASFLPRDPVLLTLMSMQKNGDFVSNVLGDGLGRGWAPELRELLSFDAVKKAGELKRKRDSGISDMDVETAKAAPALELGEEEGFTGVDEGVGLDTSFNQRSEIEFPGEEEGQVLPATDDEVAHQAFEEHDDTVVQPVDSGPVSVGTKHAVHVLRDRLGGAAAEQKKSRVTFQDLMPEKETSRADATRMFFEVLVLATKDAVQVDQGTDTLGGSLKIRGKRALWGSWAEEDADGELAGQPSQVAA